MTKNNSEFLGLAGGLFLGFLVLKILKIGKVANWSWLWVCSPVWMPFAFFVAVFLIAFVYYLITDRKS